jgi:hypothetical protein
MRDAVLVAGTVLAGVGLVLIMWRELGNAAERRKVGRLRDVIEVVLPVAVAVALLVWVWVD